MTRGGWSSAHARDSALPCLGRCFKAVVDCASYGLGLPVSTRLTSILERSSSFCLPVAGNELCSSSPCQVCTPVFWRAAVAPGLWDSHKVSERPAYAKTTIIWVLLSPLWFEGCSLLLGFVFAFSVFGHCRCWLGLFMGKLQFSLRHWELTR